MAFRPNFKQDTVIFYTISPGSYYNPIDQPNSQSISLLSKINSISIFDCIPKDFTISTKNGEYHFNLEMLKETSPVISEYVRTHPSDNNYFLNINDEENVLRKLEKLYHGETVIFIEDELPSSQRITKTLKIKNLPNCLKPDSLKTNDVYFSSNFSKESEIIIEINQKCLINFLNRIEYQSFKIITNKKEYKCNNFGIYSSAVIRAIVEKDSSTDQFNYSFEDEFDEFQSICDFFNFKQIDITSNNMYFLKDIAEDLQIECILLQIHDFINKYEKNSKKIDEYQTIIDSIDELFEWLNNIKMIGFENVKNSIIQSNWSKSIEKVQELASFILQVVRPTFSIQNEMADLLIALNKEANDTNHLYLLIPFIVDSLFIYYMPHKTIQIEEMNQNQNFRQQLPNQQLESDQPHNQQNNASYINETVDLSSKCIYSFIRILYKRGIISKDRIIDSLKHYDLKNNLINQFFLPEIIEINPKSISSMTMIKPTLTKLGMGMPQSQFNFILFVKKYLPNKIDIYEKMLDKMEACDELTRSIKNDDVDMLQKIVTINEIDVTNSYIPYNIFDNFEEDVNYLNYSAFCGSLKCFKYLLLNDGEIDESTFYFAVYGGNIEIIKIVDQKMPDISSVETSHKNGFRLSGTTSFSFGNKKINTNAVWFKNNNKSVYGFNKYDNKNDYNAAMFDNNLHSVSSYRGIYTINLNCCNACNIIASAIAFNRNDLFDWIFEKEFLSKGKIGNELFNLAILAAANGNAHALIEIIDKGFDITSNSICDDLIFFSAKNGFCNLTQLLMNIAKNSFLSNNNSNLFIYKSSVLFGNLAIFKLFIEQIHASLDDMEKIVLIAIEMNYKEIILYVFDHIENLNISLNRNFIFNALQNSVKSSQSIALFDFLNDQFKKLKPEIINLSLFSELLDCSCLYSNLSATKIITEFILKENSNFNFSTAFIKAASSGSMNICYYFVDKKVNINYYELSSQVDKLGLIDSELFEMIYNDVGPNIQFQLLKCLEKAIQNKNKKLIKFLLKQGSPIRSSLYQAVMTHDVEIVDLILEFKSDPAFVNFKFQNGTAIHIASSSKDLDIVKRLLSVPGINPGLINRNSTNALSAAIYNYDIDIVEAILDFYGDEFMSNIPIFINSFQALQNCLKGSQIDKLMWNIVSRFLDIKSIDPNLIFADSSLLIKACIQNEIEIVEKFLKLEKIDINQYQQSSYVTPLLAAIDAKNTKIVELLIKYPKTNLNLRDIHGDSPLIFAVRKNLIEVINLLVNDERFDQFENKLCYALILAKDEVFQKLCSLSFLDVNQQFLLSKKNNSPQTQTAFISYETTALLHLVKINDVDKIDFIINHHSFNKYKSDVYSSLFVAAKQNNINFFRKLIELVDNDVNIFNKKGKSLLDVAAIYSSGDIIDEIINNPKFDPIKGQICQSFIDSYSKPSQHIQNAILNVNQHVANPPLNFIPMTVMNQVLIPNKINVIETMNKLFEYDDRHLKLIDFNKLNQTDGKSFFTSICFNYDELSEVSNFLLDHGVDPNKPDSNGIFPLEHAISINSDVLVTSLLNSNKIDFYVVLNGGDDHIKTTYLHLTAMNDNPNILRLLLNRNEVDINSTDEMSETPLMVACRRKLAANVNVLFQKENLDFLHRNKDGKDAIEIIQNLSLKEIENARKTKDNYYRKIIDLINGNNS